MNTTWYFLIKIAVKELKNDLNINIISKTNLKKINKKSTTLSYFLKKIAKHFNSIAHFLKTADKQINLLLSIYVFNLNLNNTSDILKKKINVLVDLRNKQVFLTKSSGDFNSITTLSNNSFLKKLKMELKSSKHRFLLKNDVLMALFSDILKVHLFKSNLLIKGHTYDLNLFFQKLEKNSIINHFQKVFLNYSDNFNQNKKKRIRSLKKRFRKGFIRTENNNNKIFLKKN